MAASEFGTGKSIIVLAIVVGCFAILWPKIFYPMMQAAFTMTSPKADVVNDGPYRPTDRPPHVHPGIIDPHIKEALPDIRQAEKVHVREGRPFPHPSSRQPIKPQPKSGGAMSIIMPIYTIGIVVFFLYTVLKLVFKKSPDADKKPLIKDFHMDADYHKFVCQQPVTEYSRPHVKEKKPFQKQQKVHREPSIPEKNEDYEIYQLRKKLEETESAMERIMKHMGAVSECLSSGLLLKEGNCASTESKNEGLQTLNSQSTVESCKAISKSNTAIKKDKNLKNKKHSIDLQDNTQDSEKLSANLDHNHASTDAQTSFVANKDQTEGCSCAEKSSVDNMQQMKRDSSVNSETSSFEVLSQSLNSSSSACIIATSSGSECSDDNATDNEESGNSGENPSFEALEKICDADDDNLEKPVDTESELAEDQEILCEELASQKYDTPETVAQ